MNIKYDREADAIYVRLTPDKQYAYGKDLDDERRIDYAADRTPIGVELLCVSQGVNLSGLPEWDQIAKLLAQDNINVYILEPQTITECLREIHVLSSSPTMGLIQHNPIYALNFTSKEAYEKELVTA